MKKQTKINFIQSYEVDNQPPIFNVIKYNYGLLQQKDAAITKFYNKYKFNINFDKNCHLKQEESLTTNNSFNQESCLAIPSLSLNLDSFGIVSDVEKLDYLSSRGHFQPDFMIRTARLIQPSPLEGNDTQPAISSLVQDKLPIIDESSSEYYDSSDYYQDNVQPTQPPQNIIRQNNLGGFKGILSPLQLSPFQFEEK